MSDTPIEVDTDPNDPATDGGLEVDPGGAPGSDEGHGDDVEPIQTGEPATGPEAPVPPTGSHDADTDEPI